MSPAPPTHPPHGARSSEWFRRVVGDKMAIPEEIMVMARTLRWSRHWGTFLNETSSNKGHAYTL